MPIKKIVFEDQGIRSTVGYIVRSNHADMMPETVFIIEPCLLAYECEIDYENTEKHTPIYCENVEKVVKTCLIYFFPDARITVEEDENLFVELKKIEKHYGKKRQAGEKA